MSVIEETIGKTHPLVLERARAEWRVFQQDGVVRVDAPEPLRALLLEQLRMAFIAGYCSGAVQGKRK